MGFGLGSIGGFVSGAIGAGATLGGFDKVASAAGIAGDAFAAQSNLDEAQAARDFSADTMQRRYQWTMADMKKAGLNPILAYQQGAGSGMPGAMGKVISSAAGALPAVNTAIQAEAVENTIRKQQEEIKNLEETRKNTKQDTKLKTAQETNVFSDSVLKHAQQLNVTSQTGVNSAQAANIQQQTINSKLEQFRREAVAEGAKSEKEIMETTLGKYLRWVDIVGRSVNPFSSSRSK